MKRLSYLPHCFEGIVGVHDGVDQVVHDDEPPCGSCVFGEGVPSVQKHGEVVVPETLTSTQLLRTLEKQNHGSTFLSTRTDKGNYHSA